jgi:hypothetical protein
MLPGESSEFGALHWEWINKWISFDIEGTAEVETVYLHNGGL